MIDLWDIDDPAKFNETVVAWLEHEKQISNHVPPKTFPDVIPRYHKALDALKQKKSSRPEKDIMNRLTDILLGVDLRQSLEKRLESESTSSGFRSPVSQGMAKNTGENFVNLIVYNLARSLGDTGICVEKGTPPRLREESRLERKIFGEKLEIPIEGDLTVFEFDNPLNAIMVNAKTRLKEIFHVGTMWKLFFDIASSEELLRKWELGSKARDLDEVLYCFATADLVPPGGTRSQGPDVEVKDPRNLLKVDASFFDF